MDGRHVLALVGVDPEECQPDVPAPVVRLTVAALRVQGLVGAEPLLYAYAVGPVRDVVMLLAAYIVAVRAEVASSGIKLSVLRVWVRTWIRRGQTVLSLLRTMSRWLASCSYLFYLYVYA